MNPPKVTNAMRETCASHWPAEMEFGHLSATVIACCEAGLLYSEDVGHGWVRVGLLEPGRKAAAEHNAKRARRNAVARGRSEAMRSLGLVRTRNGSWE